jgi:hypothetical protein
VKNIRLFVVGLGQSGIFLAVAFGYIWVMDGGLEGRVTSWAWSTKTPTRTPRASATLEAFPTRGVATPTDDHLRGNAFPNSQAKQAVIYRRTSSERQGEKVSPETQYTNGEARGRDEDGQRSPRLPCAEEQCQPAG